MLTNGICCGCEIMKDERKGEPVTREPLPKCVCGCGRSVRRWYSKFYSHECRKRAAVMARPMCRCGCGVRVLRPGNVYASHACACKDPNRMAVIKRKGVERWANARERRA